MKKKLLLLLVTPFVFWFNASAVNIVVIESHSADSWSTQDSLWWNLAIHMGYHATVDSSSILNDTAFFANTDVVIVSEAAINFSNIQLQNLIKFVKKGKPAYIQSEYLNTYQGDITFQAIMDSVGANFKWVGTVSGNLSPMKILGVFATTPYKTDSINYFNYGLSGTGNGVDSFLEYNNQFFGFYYHDANHRYGSVITVSDEDWVWPDDDSLLMKNMLYQLINSVTAVKNISNNTEVNIFPNPNKGIFTIKLPGNQTDYPLEVYNLIGQKIYQSVLTPSQNTVNISTQPEGIYFAYLKSEEGVEVKKIMVVK